MKITFFLKKSKIILFGFILFLMGYFAINYIHSDKNFLKIQNLVIKEKLNNKKDVEKKKPLNDLKNDLKRLKTDKINLKEFEKLKTKLKFETIENELIEIIDKENSDSKPKQEINENKIRYLAFDSGGFGSVNSGVIKCTDNLEVEIVNSNSVGKDIDILYGHMSAPNIDNLSSSNTKKLHTMVFTMESEVHSYGGETWKNSDFRMWYNLDKSFPEPATYFDVKVHLIDLLSPPKIEFENKENKSEIVWVVSNCNAYNGRENYMKYLMDRINLDSYGSCLKNKFTHPSEHMKGNIELFSNYKFVIAIENSNCEDYVTEKLVHAVASGSIPIVAGKNNKPDYLKFMPKDSYINIYDYKSVDDLVKKLKFISSNKNEYEKYIKFKRHNYTREYLHSLSLNEVIKLAKTIIDPNEKFFGELIKKEKSENKLCKIARYLKNTPDYSIRKHQIESNKINRPEPQEACLDSKNLNSLIN